METITLSQNDQLQAGREADSLGVLNNSITGGRGNLAGKLGEIAVARFLGVKRGRDTRDYDLLYEGKRIEVKTKNCTSPPKPSYRVSVAATNIRQQCDFYVFTRLLSDLKTCYLLGFMPKEVFYKEAEYYEKGQVDPDGDGKWVFKESCYNMPIEALRGMEGLR